MTEMYSTPLDLFTASTAHVRIDIVLLKEGILLCLDKQPAVYAKDKEELKRIICAELDEALSPPPPTGAFSINKETGTITNNLK